MKVINKDLLKLDFPPGILYKIPFTKYNVFTHSIANLVYLLSKIYNPDLKVNVEKRSYSFIKSIYLDNILIIDIKDNSKKKQNLQPVRTMVEELLKQGLTYEDINCKITRKKKEIMPYSNYWYYTVNKYKTHIFSGIDFKIKTKIKVIKQGYWLGEGWQLDKVFTKDIIINNTNLILYNMNNNNIILPSKRYMFEFKTPEEIAFKIKSKLIKEKFTE